MEQWLHDLITKIERICMGFDNHKQEIFNLVQALKRLFLYSQSKKESVEESSRNFKSLWDIVEAFRGLPEIHKGLVEGLLATPDRLVDPSNVMEAEQEDTEVEVMEAMKAALLISGANKARNGWLKEQLAKNNMLEKATRIQGNFQEAGPSQFGEQRSKRGGLPFIQKGGRGG